MTLLKKLLFNLSPVFKFEISGDSMSPTLRSGQEVLVNRASHLLRKPKAKEIIAVKDPRDKKILIKRIAKSNDGKFFVVGDNEAASTDSRHFGWITKKDIIGKVIYSSKGKI